MPAALPASFADRLEALRPDLVRLAASFTGPNDAEDAVQEAIVAAYRQRDLFDEGDGDTGFRAWISSIVVHRAKQRRPAPPLAPETIADLIDRQAPLAPSEDYRTALYLMIDRADLTYLQECCLRLWLDGLSQKQIGDFLQIRQASVCGHIQAATYRLKQARQHVLVLRGGHWFGEVSTPAVYYSPTFQAE